MANDLSHREMNGGTYDVIAQYTKTNEFMKMKKYNNIVTALKFVNKSLDMRFLFIYHYSTKRKRD